MNTDKQRIDWLEEAARQGGGLISDDAGRWAFATDGTQNLPNAKRPMTISTTFFVSAREWRESVRAAIDAAMEARA